MVPEGMKHNLTEYISSTCLLDCIATGSESVWSKVDPLYPPEPKDLEKHFCEANVVPGNFVKWLCLYMILACCTGSIQYHERLADMCKNLYSVQLECMGEGYLIGMIVQ